MNNKNISPFQMQLIYLLGVSFIAAICCDMFLNTLSCIKSYAWYGQILVILFVFFSIIIGLIINITFMIKYRQLRKESYDRNHNLFEEEIVYLRFSESLIKTGRKCFVDHYIAYLFHSEKAVYQKCYFDSITSSKSDNFIYFILTTEKINSLRNLYPSLSVAYRDIGFWPASICFGRGVPIKLIYGCKSHVLVKVECVEGYEYSEIQIESINNLNKRILGYYCRLKKNPITLDNFKEKVAYNHGDIFQYMPLYSFFVAIVISIVISCTIMYLGDTIFLLVEYGMIGFVACFRPIIEFFCVIFIFCGIIFSAGNFLDFIDQRKNRYITRDVIFTYSSSIGIADGYHRFFKMIYKNKNISLHKVSYKLYGSSVIYDSKKYVYYVLSDASLCFFQNFYECWLMNTFVNERFGSLYQTSIKMYGDIPLRIILGKSGRVLKSVSAVPGYEYTEAQLAAIEKFNTLYP